MAAFTYQQKKVLSIIPHVTGPFSLFGSSLIIYEILRDRKTKWSKTYHRLLFGMATSDAISSVAFGLSTWPIPRNSEGVYAARGTAATCSAQGFFVQASIAVPLYNLSLSIYYLLLVKYSIPENTIRRKYEPWMHGSVMFFALTTALIGLGMNWYHDSSLWCWFNALPKGCTQSYKNGGWTTCDVGDNAQIFRWALYYAPLWASITGTCVGMFLLWRSVRRQEEKERRWRQRWTRRDATSSQYVVEESVGTGRSSSSSLLRSLSSSFMGSMQRKQATDDDRGPDSFADNDDADAQAAVVGAANDEDPRQRQRMMQRQNKKSSAVMWQALRYTAAFWTTWLFGSLNRLLQLAGYNVFWVMVLHSFFVPLQGFFNMLVYRYPRFHRWYKDRQEKKRKKRAGKREGNNDPANGNGNGNTGSKIGASSERISDLTASARPGSLDSDGREVLEKVMEEEELATR